MATNPSLSSPSSSSSSSLHTISLSPSPSPSPFLSPNSLKLISSNDTPTRIFIARSSNGGDGFEFTKSTNSKGEQHEVIKASMVSSVPSSTSSSIDFLTLCNRLKTTKRKGWINHGIKGPESIADHMYRMALMALIAGDLPGGVNRERCIKIAIVHDIAEAIVGDITPADGVPKAEKSRLEQEALNEMCEVLGGGLRAEEIQELWAEYENNSSREANLVKDFDKVEMILQALEYEMGFVLPRDLISSSYRFSYEFSKLSFEFCGLSHMSFHKREHGKVLDEFFLSTAGKFQTEIGKSWAAEIISRRSLMSGNTR
ncbi:hypothetical protein GIB67_038516 [Kingdonia uniflora]|uniref:5'-deoxynucleotidase n=1 Tax=Kingdonia uniflora TaxID=39325 RepID=A0A7J7NPB2_9MAGN|nr:hypothetical protein GIB67_038516 [Kingdonia uniflora]